MASWPSLAQAAATVLYSRLMVGSFKSFPAVTVSATAGPDMSLPFAIARVERVLWSPESGYVQLTVGVSATSPDKTPVDNGFHFIAAESLQAPVQ